LRKEDLTYKVIGCAMKVHAALGSGYQEVIYQRALAIELAKQGIRFIREYKMQVYYEGIKIGERRVDFLIEGWLVLEIKAVAILEDCFLAQVMNYIEMFKFSYGLLINFGSPSLGYKRIYNLKHPDNLVR
jgi:GxxExxY protein